jgi:hypothetical protein
MNCSTFSIGLIILMTVAFISPLSYAINIAQATFSPPNLVDHSLASIAVTDQNLKKADPDGDQLQIRGVGQVNQIASDTLGHRTIVGVTCDQPFALMGGMLFLSVNGANDALSPQGVWTPFFLNLGAPLPTPTQIRPGTVTIDIGGHLLGGPVGVGQFGSNNPAVKIIYTRASADGSPNGDHIVFAPVIMTSSSANCRTTGCTGPLSSC